jgi:hypothetical protein
MNPRRLFVLIPLAATACLGDPFQNLGFDSADTRSVPTGPDGVARGVASATALLPGWTLSMGGMPKNTLGLNLNLMTFGYCTLVSADQGGAFGYPIDGGFALRLVGTPGNQDPFTLAQQGDIPADSHWLSYHYSGYPFLLAVNGDTLAPQIHTTSMEAFDISRYSGQSVDLTFRSLGPLMPTSAGSSFIDSVAFTVPEPSTCVLLLLGASVVSMALARRRIFPRS